jgi:hypothetical protein
VYAVADRLAQPPGGWARFTAPLPLRHLYAAGFDGAPGGGTPGAEPLGCDA